MKKRILPILVSLIAALVMVPLVAGTSYAAGEAVINCDNGLKCRVTPSKGEAVVCGRAEDNTSETITIAPFQVTYGGVTYDVTTVEGAAFSNDTVITELIVEEGITSIGGMAFRSCSNLAAISLPDSLVSFPKNAFENTAYYAANWEDNMLYISNYLVAARSGASARELKAGTVAIADAALDTCSGLSSVTIPASVQRIGSSAFKNCSSLSSVTFASGSQLKEIGASAFDECQLNSIVIPDSVDTIGSFAFYGNRMETVVLPEGLEVIDTKVFGNCSRLEEITIPSTVKEIKEDAFSNCSNLETVHYGGSPTQWEAITGGGKPQGETIDIVYGVTTEISATVTFKVVHGSWNDVDGDGAKADITVELTGYEGDTLRLTADQIPAVGDKPDVTYKTGNWDPVPSTETAISDGATFTYTYAETNEGQLTDEINWALDDNGALTLKLADGASSAAIPDYSNEQSPFFNNARIKAVTVENGITRIGANTFANCSSLEKVVFKGDFCIEQDAFSLCDFSAYYPLHNNTWSEAAIASGYGANVKWIGYCDDPQPGDAVQMNVKAATVFAAGSYDSVVFCKVCKTQLSSEMVTIQKLKPTIKLSKKKKTLKKGKKYKLKVSNLAYGDAVKSFKSSKKSVATVTSKGVIKAKKKGKATITVKLKSGKTAKCKIIVKR